MKKYNWIWVVLLSAVVAFAVVKISGPAAGSAPVAKETAYERVKRTGVLRCGYATLPPMIMVDPKTREVSGMDHEIIELVAKKMGLKVEWTAETGYGTSQVGVASGKFDMFCNASWLDTRRAMAASLSRPMYYNPMFPVVRYEDKRFDANLGILNNPQYIIAGLDNDPTMDVALQDYPLAKKFGWSELVSYAEAVESLLGNKADIFFSSYPTAADYIQKNPNKIRFLIDNPVRIFPVGYQLPADAKFKAVFDVALGEVILSGTMDKILQKYLGTDPRNYLPVNKEYLDIGRGK